MDDSTLQTPPTQSALRTLTPPSSSSSSQLNLSAEAASKHIDRLLNSSYHTGPSRTIYSDRFIPSRSGSNFALFDLVSPKASSTAEGREDTSSAYATLLRAALFGPETSGAVAFPATPDKRSTPSRNIFRYKSETRRSMHSLLPFGFDEAVQGVNHGPVKAPRKVPRSPYKVKIMWIC